MVGAHGVDLETLRFYKGKNVNMLLYVKYDELVDEVQSIVMKRHLALTFFSFESLLIVSVVGGWDRLLVSEGNVLKMGKMRDLLKRRGKSRVMLRATYRLGRVLCRPLLRCSTFFSGFH